MATPACGASVIRTASRLSCGPSSAAGLCRTSRSCWPSLPAARALRSEPPAASWTHESWRWSWTATWWSKRLTRPLNACSPRVLARSARGRIWLVWRLRSTASRTSGRRLRWARGWALVGRFSFLSNSVFSSQDLEENRHTQRFLAGLPAIEVS